MICLDDSELQNISKSFEGFSFRDDFMISLEQNCVFVFCCRKIFHAKCLYTWNKKNMNCPHCRKELDITSYVEYYSEDDSDNEDIEMSFQNRMEDWDDLSESENDE